MSYSARDDWDGDDHRWNPHVHYRLYLSATGAPSVICVQDFDYPDYDARMALSPDAWDDEGEAEEALLALSPAIELASRTVPTTIDSELRARLLARAIRNAEADDRRHREEIRLLDAGQTYANRKG